jgi:ATP-dependent RNA circularization protein (DNA/RNA ligase family)
MEDFRKYPKIETLFERDMEGTKKLIWGRFRNPAVQFLQDSRWVFTEKVDGTNIRVCWDGYKVFFRGRGDNSSIPTKLIEALGNSFMGDSNEQIFESLFGERPVILYGEGYGGNIQVGEGYRKDVGFVLFDVLINGVYLERDNVQEIAKGFGVPCVPIILSGTINEAIEFIKKRPNSVLAEGTIPMEGVVGTPEAGLLDRRGKRIIVKIKAADFVDECPKSI